MLEIRNGEFFWESKPFTPLISEDGLGNVCQIVLAASIEDDLDWTGPLEKAQKAIENNQLIFWEFDFQITSLKEQSSFHSYALSIDHFKENVLKVFQKNTLGVCLYRGTFQLAFNEEEKERFEEWLLDRNSSLLKAHLKNLYSATLLAEYLHRLASCLPDEIQPFCLFDASALTSAEALQLFSKERFAHLHLGLHGAKIPMSPLSWEKGEAFGGWIGSGLKPSFDKRDYSYAVVLPVDELCSQESLVTLDRLFLELKEKQISFRVIPEFYLTEEWEGIDFLFTLYPSVLGKRKLQGFCAAGGEVISIGEKIGLVNEMLYMEWAKK